MDFKERLLVFLLLLSFGAKVILSIREQSGTFDEHPHLASGYSYLKTGDYRLNKEHPPLQKLLCAIPLIFLNISLPMEHPSWKNSQQWVFSDVFMYKNNADAEKILFWGRVATVVLSIFFGYFVFAWTKKIFGVKSAFFSLLFYILCPNISAHSGVVTTDLSNSCFIFISLYTLWLYLKSPLPKLLLFTGVSLGCALASKFTALILLPIYIFFFLIIGRRKLIEVFVIFLVAFIILAIFYQIDEIGKYFEQVKMVFSDIAGGRTGYLMGKYSNVGWREYYIVAFLLKTPLPIIIFMFFSFLFIKNIGLKDCLFLLTAPALIFLSASFSRMQIGLRHILPVYPFIFVLTSSLAKTLRKPRFLIAFIFLFGWYVFSCFKIHPYYLAYFNELCGGPENGWRYLADSNIDWGQDLKRLKRYLVKEDIKNVILSYFGNVDPYYYQLEYQDLSSLTMFQRESKVLPLTTKKEIIAISVNNLLTLYFYDRNVFNWLKEKKPIKKIGYSIFIYDITNDVFSHENLARVYFNSGLLDEAYRHCQKLLLMDPNNKTAHFILSCIYADRNVEEEAINSYKKLLEISPDYAPERNTLANLYNYQRVKFEHFYSSLFKLAHLFQKREMFKEARTVYGKILIMYPDSKEARECLNKLG